MALALVERVIVLLTIRDLDDGGDVDMRRGEDGRWGRLARPFEEGELGRLETA